LWQHCGNREDLDDERTVEVAQCIVFPLVGRSWSADYQTRGTTVLKLIVNWIYLA